MPRHVCTLLTLGLLLVAACGDDGDDNGFVPNLQNDDAGNVAPNNSDTDGGTDTGANNVVDAGDVAGDCSIQKNLGVLGDMLSDDGEFAPAASVSATSCAGDNPDGETDGASVLYFQLDVPRRIDVRVDGVPRFDNDDPVIPPDPSWEIRSAPCDSGDVQLCSATRDGEIDLPAGDYFLVINGRLDSGGYRLEMSSQELVCMTGGEPVCQSDQIERCVMGTALETYDCFAGCLDGTTCSGDSCADAVDVTIEANGQPYTVLGHRRAQTDTWTAAGLDACELFPGDPSPDTSGVDLFVRVDNLFTGQTLTIDAERSDGNYAFFVLADCSATACLHAGDFDAESANRTEWRVDQNGSVLIAVEALGTSEREIVVDILVTE